MAFDPKCVKFPYGEITDQHYLPVERIEDITFDENYPFYDTSKKFQRKQRWVRFLLRTIVFPLTRIRLNLRVKGRENLKLYQQELSQGYITVCNHVHMWDYLAILLALKTKSKSARQFRSLCLLQKELEQHLSIASMTFSIPYSLILARMATCRFSVSLTHCARLHFCAELL